MARFDIDEHFFTGDIYEVSKDDWSKRRRFTDRVEAEAYYEMLKREEVQDSIARNQATTVEQNKEIIANQQRLIEEQQRNNRMQQRPPFPHPSRPVVDPEYQEWLQFKKETDPAYQKWKKEKEAEKARINAANAAREAERARQLAEKQRKEEISSNKSKVSTCKAILEQQKLAINTYIKWWPIIEQLAKAGVGPVSINLNGGGTEYKELPHFIKDFLEFKTKQYPGFASWKKKYVEMRERCDEPVRGTAEERSFWVSGVSTLRTHQKYLQRCIKFEKSYYSGGYGYGRDRRDGLVKYLEILTNNLSQARNYRQWGWFSDVRTRDKNYWERYQGLYTILMPHLNEWRKDMDKMFIREYDEDDE